MGKRRKAREWVLQILYTLEVTKEDPEQAFEILSDNFQVEEAVRDFAKDLLQGICRKKEEMDRLIREASTNWRLERMPMVDRSILRLAVYEILYRSDIPPKVSIDEAVEMGKRFGSEQSGGFINGVLDRIYKGLRGEAVETGPLPTDPESTGRGEGNGGREVQSA